MIFPKDKGFKHEAYGAGDVQALLKAQEVRDQKHDKEELEEVITDLNDLSAKYGGIGTATTYNEAMENLEETIQEQSGTLVEKNITENGVYNASSDNADGYSEVTVNVPQANNAKFIYTIPTQYFSMHNIKSIVIPEGCIGVSGGAFSSCQLLDSVTLPTTLESIGQKAFSACQGLTSIEIPASVTTISSEAFLQCTNMQTIIVNKPEGSISGAPWGATNAEVIWTG